MSKHHFTFRKDNYKLLIAGVVLVIIGFVLMIGGGSDNPNDFNEKELFSFQRITLAPFLVLAGYAVVVYAIMKKPRTE